MWIMHLFMVSIATDTAVPISCNYSYSNTNIVNLLLLRNASAQLFNIICIQYAKYEICIFMNIDENTRALSEIDEQNKKRIECLTEVNVPISHLSNTIHCQLYAKPLLVMQNF